MSHILYYWRNCGHWVQLKLIAPYLQNRVQQGEIGNCQSVECLITSGVPQGSVLFLSGVPQGPLFFIAFIIYLPEKCVCAPFLLPDDLKLASSSPIELQKDLLSLMKWSKENKLDFNLKKTKLLQIKFTDYYSKSKIQCDYIFLNMAKMISFLQQRVLVIFVFGSLQI